jgi:hypothetical protein
MQQRAEVPMLAKLEEAAETLARPRHFLDEQDRLAAVELVGIVRDISSSPGSSRAAQMEDLLAIAEVLIARSKSIS